MQESLNYLYNWISSMPPSNTGIIAFILVLIAIVIATPPDNAASSDTDGW